MDQCSSQMNQQVPLVSPSRAASQSQMAEELNADEVELLSMQRMLAANWITRTV